MSSNCCPCKRCYTPSVWTPGCGWSKCCATAIANGTAPPGIPLNPTPPLLGPSPNPTTLPPVPNPKPPPHKKKQCYKVAKNQTTPDGQPLPPNSSLMEIDPDCKPPVVCGTVPISQVLADATPVLIGRMAADPVLLPRIQWELYCDNQRKFFTSIIADPAATSLSKTNASLSLDAFNRAVKQSDKDLYDYITSCYGCWSTLPGQQDVFSAIIRSLNPDEFIQAQQLEANLLDYDCGTKRGLKSCDSPPVCKLFADAAQGLHDAYLKDPNRDIGILFYDLQRSIETAKKLVINDPTKSQSMRDTAQKLLDQQYADLGVCGNDLAEFFDRCYPCQKNQDAIKKAFFGCLNPDPVAQAQCFKDKFGLFACGQAPGGSSASRNPIPIPTLFNTGVDSNKQVLPDLSPDPHYSLTVVDNTSAGYAESVSLPQPAQVWGPLPNGWMPDETQARTLGINYRPPPHDFTPANSVPYPGYYTMVTTFDLTNFQLPSVVITWLHMVDGLITEVQLNGTVITGYPNPNVQYLAWQGPWTVPTASLVQGLNTLSIKWWNEQNLGGFKLKISGIGIPK